MFSNIQFKKLIKKKTFHLKIQALLQIVGGDKLIIPFC
ncbi:hypothetical protein J926_2879 [Acinetobacter baumannii 44437_3]|nr:hypothetical protein J928_2748 [Acinetobacter baumannii 44437_5]EYC72146.1 hypothetical protein J926_2879 [Acinetobacter baumannii 44437_3]EZI78683.1 hypothetical protein J980_3971 [Acinetobacter baumannii 44298_4]EZI91221.1 hypothetical protein J978_2614 [Acinetobacter baumannii 44298_2]KCV93298.1 hypothetical protein J984_3056 [Acinetobacter baumannii 44298_8]